MLNVSGRQSFLNDAVRATVHDLHVTSPEALARSTRTGVVRLAESDRKSFAFPRVVAVGCLLFSVLCLVGAVGVQFITLTGWGDYAEMSLWKRLLISLILVILAVMSLILPLGIEKRTAKAIALSRRAPDGFDSPEIVGIEPTSSYERLKVALADDIGTLYHDRIGNRLLIDGLAHRYLICPDGIKGLQLGSVKLGTGVQLDLQIGSTNLSIVISAREQDLNVAKVSDPSFDARKDFAKHLRATLGIKESAAG